MAHVPGFNHDVFISYSHFDNQAVDEHGWVSDFHRRLQIELDEELGEKSSVWRDVRIGSADDFTADLTKQLKSTAVLLAIVSPGYLNSRWCGWELQGFVEGERRTGDLWVEAKCRAIKIIKRPGDQNAHRNLAPRETAGVELFETDRASGRNHELKPESDLFQRRLTELANEKGDSITVPEFAVLLGVAPDAGDPLTAQVRAQRERLLGHEVRPFVGGHGVAGVRKETVPTDVVNVEVRVHDEIHPVGARACTREPLE